MFVDGGWKRPASEPPRRPRLTERQERILLLLIAANALLLLVAPIGGSTIIHAVLAVIGHG